MLRIQLGLPHTSIAGIFLMCVHTSHWPYGYPPFMLCSWQWMHRNSWCSLWHLCYHCMGCWFPCGPRTTTCASFKYVQFFMLMSWQAHQRWHLHLSHCCHCQPNTSRFISPIWCHPRICYFRCGSSQRMKLSWSTPHPSIPPLSNGGIWMST
jgi:hypothetical protein